MKKRILSLALAAAAALVFASAAGGGADNPLISLRYLQDVFAPKAESAAQDRIDAAASPAYDSAAAKWRAAVSAAENAAEADGSWSEVRLKEGDVLSVSTGAQVLLLAGSAANSAVSGAVVDTTEGVELDAGAALPPRHRCLAAEDTTARFTVTSRTAVVKYSGGAVEPCADTPDYNAMASALRTLSLFRGTGTGYGEGFDLETAPTRVQALVMLIRLLGEENAALSSAAAHPFGDVPEWADRYVAYAYEQGYTNGVSATRFAPNSPANAGMYVEFVLRALGYSDTTQADVSTAAARALDAGVLTGGEKAALKAADFLRADVVYLSWYALDAPLAGETRLLREKLTDNGVFSPADYEYAAAGVTSARR